MWEAGRARWLPSSAGVEVNPEAAKQCTILELNPLHGNVLPSIPTLWRSATQASNESTAVVVAAAAAPPTRHVMMCLLLLEQARPLLIVLLVQVLRVLPAGRSKPAKIIHQCWAGLQSASGVRAVCGRQC